MAADPITTDEEAAPRGGTPRSDEICCQVCGLAINPLFGIDTHYDCATREARRHDTVKALSDVAETTVASTRLGDHAAAYARAGLAVLPLHPRAKTPATRHGKDDASIDVDRITSWWSRHPDHNIGVRPADGVVVLDIDPRNGGDTALARLVGRHEPLPLTWTCHTGSGGQHVWLRARGPFRGQLCPGVDLKSRNGYLVMPPSVHPNGQEYRWLNTAPIAHAPAWLRPLLLPPVAPTGRSPSVPTQASGNGLIDVVATAAEGNRNSALFWAASRAAAEGSLTAMAAQLVAAAVANGLPEREAHNTIRSAERTAK